MDHQRRDLPRLPGDHFGRDEGQAVALPGDERREGGKLPPRAERRRRVAGPLSGETSLAVGRALAVARPRRRAERPAPLLRVSLLGDGLALRLGSPVPRGVAGMLAGCGIHVEFDRPGISQRLQTGLSICRRKFERIQSRKKTVGTPMVKRPLVPAEPSARSEPEVESFFSDLVGQRSAQADTMSISSLVTSVHPATWRPQRESAEAVFLISLMCHSTGLILALLAVLSKAVLGPSPKIL